MMAVQQIAVFLICCMVLLICVANVDGSFNYNCLTTNSNPLCTLLFGFGPNCCQDICINKCKYTCDASGGVYCLVNDAFCLLAEVLKCCKVSSFCQVSGNGQKFKALIFYFRLFQKKSTGNSLYCWLSIEYLSAQIVGVMLSHFSKVEKL